MSRKPTMSNDQLALFVAVAVAVFGGISFSRSSEDEPAGKAGQVESAEGNETRAASRDPRLVGDWRYTETYASDGFSMAFDQFMTFDSDGTLTVREGAAAGGGGGFTFDEPQSDQSMTCEWRTSGNVIEIRGEGRDWSPLAEYEVSADNLLTDANGERQIWERI